MEENVKEIVREVVHTEKVELPFGFYWMMFIQVVLTGIIAIQLHNGITLI